MAKGERRNRCRGTVLVQVVVLSTVLIGSAALSVDVGMMYMAKAELQNAADAAAMAAAAELAEYEGGQATSNARATAKEYGELNEVLKDGMTIATKDVEFGRGVLQPGGKFKFMPGGLIPDAVRVTARRTSGSNDGPVPLTFARIFGFSETDIQASAAAMLIPRDIAIVADLSGSHNYDSQLMHYQITDINNYEVWTSLPQPESGNNGVGNGEDPPPAGNPLSVNDGEGTSPGDPGNAGGNTLPGADPINLPGPSWGFMGYLGWGETAMDADTYNPVDDAGLVYMRPGYNWSNAVLEDKLAKRGYSDQEIYAIMHSGNHSWTSRVAVAMGLAVWYSGIQDGYADVWEIPGGDGDWNVESSEIEWAFEYPYASGSWSDYFNYVSSSSNMTSANYGFKYRMGLKTFVDYLLVKRRQNNQTPELADTPVQPMQAVKDAVGTMMGIVDEYDGDDYVSLEIYATRGRHEVDLTNEYDAISSRLNELQPGHYDGWTNIGDGIARGIEELTSNRSRTSAKKVMMLLTDGNANTNQYYQWDYSGARQYALAMAEEAVNQGIMVYCVSVGAGADRSLMSQIATISGTQDDLFHAGGTIADYSSQLQDIFAQLGGQRPVVLIE